jgi:uncharacterized coiled-coil DUF342 family protein
MEMAETEIGQLRRVMEAGFGTLADLQRETNARLDTTIERLDATNARLDATNARLDETNVRLGETNARLGRLEGRFDNLLEVAGREPRSLRDDLTALALRVEALEREAS